MADLVVTISESVTINGALRGSANSISVPSIVDTFERVLTAAHSNTTIQLIPPKITIKL